MSTKMTFTKSYKPHRIKIVHKKFLNIIFHGEISKDFTIRLNYKVNILPPSG